MRPSSLFLKKLEPGTVATPISCVIHFANVTSSRSLSSEKSAKMKYAPSGVENLKPASRRTFERKSRFCL